MTNVASESNHEKKSLVMHEKKMKMKARREKINKIRHKEKKKEIK